MAGWGKRCTTARDKTPPDDTKERGSAGGCELPGHVQIIWTAKQTTASGNNTAQHVMNDDSDNSGQQGKCQ